MFPVKQPLALSALLLASACAVQPPLETAAAPTAAPTPAVAAEPNAEDRRLTAFLDQVFQEQVAMSPQTLTALGIKRDYHRLNDYTEAQAERQRAHAEAALRRMQAEFDPERLSPAGRLSYRLFEDQVRRGLASYEWRWHSLPFTTMGSPMGNLPTFLINQHRIDNVQDAEAYISRLREVERVLGEISANARRQAEMGIVPPRFAFAPVREDGRRILTGAPFDSGPENTVLADFRAKVERLDAPAETKQRLLGEAREALTGPFRRGYETMLATLDALEPRAPVQHGAWNMPNGGQYYAHQLRQMTTTDLPPEEIHQIGLREVARIHGEMEKIMRRVGFTGTLQQFFDHIKTDPRFQYPNTSAGREQYLADSRRYIDQAMAAAPRMFRRLPRAPLEVRAVEEWREQTAGVAFYNPPSMDGSRPGIYYVNLSDMRQVLKPQVEAIAYHEGAPGHHFQIALAQELEGVPMFRRFGGYTAYSEGWGLYAERLGQELGFYQDPYSEFGMQSLELWRAVRLVVDTGIHHKRWTREQAIEYFQRNSLLSERDIVKEVERYIGWPGQATAYKIGQLKIFELRDRARQALGPRFDIRDFHAVVLENGAMPLDEMERQVDLYIAARRG
jgi:uncharacterized protein (DUF885 family)